MTRPAESHVVDRFPNTRHPDGDWWAELWPDPEGVLRKLGLEAGRSVVDVGCGDGHFTLPAAEIVAPATVYAIDVDGICLDEIEAHALERDVENVTTVSGDARSLADLLPEPVDVVLVANTFHGVEAPTAFAEQVWRTVNPGGRFVIVNWRDVPPSESTVGAEPRGPPWDRRLSPAETRSVVRPAGFEAAAEIDLPPHHYALVFAREHDP